MKNLTEKQLKTRWTDIKKQINKRQLLAYRVDIPLEKWDIYMHSIPSNEEINRVYHAIQDDRKVKTKRIKDALSEIVGYRESKEFSRKSGVSDTSIRDILEGKKDMAGYEIIDKLELFLNAILPDFELSIENQLTIHTYSQDYLEDIAISISKVADQLNTYCFNLNQMARKQKLSESPYDGSLISPTAGVDRAISQLNDYKYKIENYWNVYIDKKLK